MKIYMYNKCDTCRKAKKALLEWGLSFDEVDITIHPPDLKQLKKVVKILKEQGLSIQNLLNTSGIQYRELKIAEKIKRGISEDDLLELLSGNGKLLKRPLLEFEKDGQLNVLVGFKEEVWSKAFGQ